MAAGELDLAGAPELGAALREQLAAGPVLLDLMELTFMDSSGIRLIDGVLRDVTANGWDLRIARAMHERVREVFTMTGLYGALPLA